MSEIWSFLVALLALPYLLVPILIRRNQHFSLEPRLRAVLGGIMPAPVEKYFDDARAALNALGFEYRIDAVSLDFGPNLRVFMRLFVETKRSIVATCSALLPDGKSEPIGHFIEFSSRYADGHEVSTHNSDVIGAPIEHNQKISSVFSKVDDLNLLFLLHERTIDQLGFSSKAACMPMQGLDLEFLIESFRNDLSRQASLGCLTLDPKNNCYRPTWAGAFLMGWYSMWPIGPLMRLWQRFKAKLKIKALEKASA